MQVLGLTNLLKGYWASQKILHLSKENGLQTKNRLFACEATAGVLEVCNGYADSVMVPFPSIYGKSKPFDTYKLKFKASNMLTALTFNLTSEA